MNDEKKAWFYQCPKCSYKFVGHEGTAEAACFKHGSRGVILDRELIPYREAMRLLYGGKPKSSSRSSKAKNNTKKSDGSPRQLSLGL